MGEGYFRKIVKGHQYEVDQVIFAPFGDDPVLFSVVTITNHGGRTANLRWIEYWGCHNYQFSYRSWMQATVKRGVNAAELRRQFGGRFAHQFQAMPNRAGLVETQKFLGRSAEDDQAWDGGSSVSERRIPPTFLGGPVRYSARRSDGGPQPSAHFSGFAGRSDGRLRYRRFRLLWQRRRSIIPSG